MRVSVLVTLVALLAACGGHSASDNDVAASANGQEATPSHGGADTHATPPPDPHAPGATDHPAAPPVPNGDRRLDARGIAVTRHADGSISVVGTDRWGGNIDITYADGHYYKHAVDTLARSVTDAQAQALRDTIPELAPEALHDTAPPVPAGAAHNEHR